MNEIEEKLKKLKDDPKFAVQLLRGVYNHIVELTDNFVKAYEETLKIYPEVDELLNFGLVLSLVSYDPVKDDISPDYVTLSGSKRANGIAILSLTNAFKEQMVEHKEDKLSVSS